MASRSRARFTTVERVGLRTANGLIVGDRPRRSPAARDYLIDAAGAILVPPLINGHTHAAMTLFRGYGDDLPLMRWLEEKIWPVERKLEPEDVYWGTRLACLEMITERDRPLLGHVLARPGRGASRRATRGYGPP